MDISYIFRKMGVRSIQTIKESSVMQFQSFLCLQKQNSQIMASEQRRFENRGCKHAVVYNENSLRSLFLFSYGNGLSREWQYLRESLVGCCQRTLIAPCSIKRSSHLKRWLKQHGGEISVFTNFTQHGIYTICCKMQCVVYSEKYAT